MTFHRVLCWAGRRQRQSFICTGVLAGRLNTFGMLQNSAFRAFVPGFQETKESEKSKPDKLAAKDAATNSQSKSTRPSSLHEAQLTYQ